MAKKVGGATVVEFAEAAVGREVAGITTLVTSLDELKIETAEQLEASSILLTTIKGRQEDLVALRQSITKPMDEARRRVVEVFQPAVDQLTNAEQTLKAAVLVYTQEQGRLRLEAQAKLNEKARLERERIQRLAERQREAGNDERALDSMQRAAEVQAPVVETPTAPTGAVHVRTTWHAEVVDMDALVKAVAAGKAPPVLLLPNMVALNRLAQTQREDMKVPGVEAVAEQGVAARVAR